jgi:hypothetical protein
MHHDVLSVDLAAGHVLDGRIDFLLLAILDECIALRQLHRVVHGELDGLHLAKVAKYLAQVVCRHVARQVAHVQDLRGPLSLPPPRPAILCRA